MKSLFLYNDNNVILSTLQHAICNITEEKRNLGVLKIFADEFASPQCIVSSQRKIKSFKVVCSLAGLVQ